MHSFYPHNEEIHMYLRFSNCPRWKTGQNIWSCVSSFTRFSSSCEHVPNVIGSNDAGSTSQLLRWIVTCVKRSYSAKPFTNFELVYQTLTSVCKQSWQTNHFVHLKWTNSSKVPNFYQHNEEIHKYLPFSNCPRRKTGPITWTCVVHNFYQHNEKIHMYLRFSNCPRWKTGQNTWSCVSSFTRFSSSCDHVPNVICSNDAGSTSQFLGMNCDFCQKVI